MPPTERQQQGGLHGTDNHRGEVGKFQSMVGSTNRIGVSEFARSREWRDRLGKVGCFEVVDRNGVVCYMFAPDYAQALSTRITDLEEQEERAAVSAMLEARRDRTEFVTGEELRDGALAYLEAHYDEMMEAVRER